MLHEKSINAYLWFNKQAIKKRNPHFFHLFKFLNCIIFLDSFFLNFGEFNYYKTIKLLINFKKGFIKLIEILCNEIW